MKAFASGMLLLLCAFSFPGKSVVGHWIIAKGDPYELSAGDTLFLEKKKRAPKMYEWGSGVSSGFEFLSNGDFNEYHNVLCSTESSPVTYGNEKWKLVEQKDVQGEKVSLEVLVISGAGRELKFEILPFSHNKMALIRK